MGRSAGRLALGAAAALAALAALPASASAVTCALPSQAEPDFATAVDVEGDISSSRAGGYLQIPFDVPAGTTAIRVRYSYDQPGNTCSAPPSPAPSNTLDIGLYSPRDAGDAFWAMDESRGWSGSAVRDLAVARNGFSDEATYEAAPKALVHGRTTRAYRPGPIPEGEWAVELGLAFIAPDTPADTDGVHYRVLVETTSSTDWSDDPYAPSGYSGAPASTGAGWYAGDLHVHGEQEPGNATMTQTFSAAFDPPAAGGAGLDFVTLVDHNNNVAHDDLADHQAANPGKLIIPGTEVTTYRGHHNNQGKGPFVDFRGGPILAPEAGTPLGSNVSDSALEQVRGPAPPSSAFAELTGGGNWSQINHPAIFRTAPAACRGCAWSYDDAETDYPKVDAIEIQTGPAGIPVSAPAAPNPFTADTLAFYEAALDTGAHIAAVGSSDDHQGGGASGPFDSPVGSATTMVYAEDLSEDAITAAVKADHTYVKPFGPDGPSVDFTAAVAGEGPARVGDTVAGPTAELTASVSGAAAAGRPGSYSLVLLRDGAPAETVPFGGDSFTRDFSVDGPARYAIAVVRTQLGLDYYEAYTSPIWVGAGGGGTPSNRFRIVKVKRDLERGTAKLVVEVPGSGALTVSGKKLRKFKRTPGEAGRVKLKVQGKTKGVDRKLERRGEARVRPRVRFLPEGGEPRSKRKKVELRLRRGS